MTLHDTMAKARGPYVATLLSVPSQLVPLHRSTFQISHAGESRGHNYTVMASGQPHPQLCELQREPGLTGQRV